MVKLRLIHVVIRLQITSCFHGSREGLRKGGSLKIDCGYDDRMTPLRSESTRTLMNCAIGPHAQGQNRFELVKISKAREFYRFLNLGG